ncbi:hypothetical protein [Variovorax paradoxus]|uniref:DUF4034 domain-containing protein n=1 Tax=Variovorax paradoxus (strain EPS) TaxID=595537 RepID=E6V0A1_VARPE|nr:hypothetical protein [Variovorax paradoxus]ADU34415.1 hypothetical protein Varpa_0193 [Variovorax paradoxus EPS]
MRTTLRWLPCVLALALAMGVAQARTASTVPLLDDVEAMYVREGSFLRSWGLEQLDGVKAKEAAGAPVSGMSLGQLISGLDEESQKEAVQNPARALRKVELGLRASQAWRSRFQEWTNIALTTEGSLHMTRWFLLGEAQDREAAHAIHEAVDDAETRPDWKGSGRYFLGARYERLSGWAKDAGRPRFEQIALIDAGIAVNKAGREKYSFDSLIGLNALYGSYAYVSGGSALASHLDEWLAYLRTQSPVDQAKSGALLADALFQSGRDAEALPWFDRYAAYWAVEPVKPALRATMQESRCFGGLQGEGFRAYARREPARFAAMRERICTGKA